MPSTTRRLFAVGIAMGSALALTSCAHPHNISSDCNTASKTQSDINTRFTRSKETVGDLQVISTPSTTTPQTIGSLRRSDYIFPATLSDLKPFGNGLKLRFTFGLNGTVFNGFDFAIKGDVQNQNNGLRLHRPADTFKICAPWPLTIQHKEIVASYPGPIADFPQKGTWYLTFVKNNKLVQLLPLKTRSNNDQGSMVVEVPKSAPQLKELNGATLRTAAADLQNPTSASTATGVTLHLTPPF